MRKVLWCSLATGVVAAACFLALAHYAYRCPESLVGRSMQVVAEASVAMQPMSGLTSLAVRVDRANETPAPLEQNAPADPQPVAPDGKDEFEAIRVRLEDNFTLHQVELDAAQIVIDEEAPMPPVITMPVNPAPTEMAAMPRSQDDELPMVPPRMPYAEEGNDAPAKAHAKKTNGSSEETEQSVFKAWIELFEEGKKEKEKAPVVEQLPAPREEQPQADPKCQEDSHLHEQYPGCPRVTCPYRDKNHVEKYYKQPWDLDPNFDTFLYLKKKGGQEASEEPRPQEKKPQHDKEQCPRTKGVDTMEYRKSDAGLDEYGPGPIQ